jgi:hypothetical protein
MTETNSIELELTLQTSIQTLVDNVLVMKYKVEPLVILNVAFYEMTGHLSILGENSITTYDLDIKFKIYFILLAFLQCNYYFYTVFNEIKNKKAEFIK